MHPGQQERIQPSTFDKATLFMGFKALGVIAAETPEVATTIFQITPCNPYGA